VIANPSLGILIEPGDVDGFVAASVELARDPARVHALGHAAAAHIADQFALSSRRAQIAQAYGVAWTTPDATAADPASPR
jgi:hypothetical protein